MYKATSFIDGRWYSQSDGAWISIMNPANKHEMVGEAQFLNGSFIKDALSAAQDAFISWSNTTLHHRVDLLKKLLVFISDHKTDLAKVITLENGKTLTESKAEIDSAVAETHYQIDFLKQGLTENIDKNEIRYEPLGVVLLITPWNFPLATVLRKLIPAILCGNTVIVKTSEFTPLISAQIFTLIEKSDLPAGSVNLILGRGQDIVPGLLSADTIRAISLTGSDATGKEIARCINNRHIRFQAEMGGSNAVVILSDADIESAVKGIISHGFCCAGQWCTGTTRVIIEKDVYNETIKLLKEMTGKIKVGCGIYSATDMGPLISIENLVNIERSIDSALKEGATLLCGGRRLSISGSDGNFFEPTLIADVDPAMLIARQEVFGPLLTIFKANNFEHALKLVNNSPYGLSCSIYTASKEQANTFLNLAEAGLCHVNLPTGYRDYSMPLQGWKESGWGLPESGRFMRDFFTKVKAVYRN